MTMKHTAVQPALSKERVQARMKSQSKREDDELPLLSCKSGLSLFNKELLSMELSGLHKTGISKEWSVTAREDKEG